MSKRTTRILAALAAISVLTAVVALAISEASAEQQSWTTPVRIDSAGPLTSVSCVSASFCAAVDGSGNALTYDGSSGSTPASIGATSLTSVSCVSASFCVAVDGSGNALTYDGSSWSAPAPIDSGIYSGEELVSVSCVSASFCVSVDGSGNALTYNGSSWSTPEPIDGSGYLSSVSCVSASFCVAVGQAETSGGGYGGYALTYNGSSWSTLEPIENGGYLSSVSCVSASFCVAVGQAETSGGSYGGYAATYNGSSWATPVSIGSDSYPSSVSCVSASFCVAVGREENGSNGNTTTGGNSYEGYAVTYNGSSWGTPSNIDSDSYLSSVSCVSVSSCIAVDGSGNALTYLGSSSINPAPAPSGIGASPDAIRQVIFVHGINASCATPGAREYKALYDAVAAQGSSVYTFCYDHDLAFGEHSSGLSGDPDRCFSNSGRQVAAIASSANVGRERETSPHHIGPLYVSANIGSARERDDGDSALAYSATKLDDCLGALVRYDVATYGHALPIAIIGNSMGGAITRGWLELARSRNSTSLDGVTTVFLLEAATQGSWVAGLGADVNQLASSLPSPPGIPSGVVGSIVSTVLQEALQHFNLNPARAGVQDLAPQSAWYRSVAAAGTPPLLHYFSLSTDIQLHVVVHDLWWTVGQGVTDFPGDGIMQLGSPAYKTLPKWGGSQFLPFGNGPDQHQYVISPNWTLNTEVSPVGAWTFLGTLAAIYTNGEHASHFNFGRYMGMESAQGQFTGGLDVSSCANGEPIGVPEEIARVFANPSDACSAAGPPVPVHALAQHLSVPVGSPTAGDPRLGNGQRPPIQAMSPTHANASAATAGAAVATATPPAAPLEILRDRDGRSTLAVGTVGSLHGEFSLSVPGHGVFVARLHLPRGRVRLDRVIEAEHLDAKRGEITRLRLSGQLDLAAHSANLRIGIPSLGIRVALLTAGTSYAHARASSERLIAALRHNEISELVGMLAVPDTAPSTLAAELAGENVHVTSIRALGPGQPIWLADGNPGWRQPVIARAANRPTLRVDLILERQHAAWKLLGSAGL